MSHRASLYTVRVRPRGETQEYEPFGDFNGEGVWLGDPLLNALRTLDSENGDATRRVRYERDLPNLVGDFVGISVISEELGVQSVLRGPDESEYDRTPEHSEGLRTGALFHLPRGRRDGHLAVHSAHNRSAKTLIERQVRSSLSQVGYIVEMAPIVPIGALRAAAEGDQIQAVRLTIRDPARLDAFESAADWGDDRVGEIAVEIVSKRGRKLRGDALVQYLDDRTERHRSAIVEFEGIQYEDAAVRAAMPDGSQRTFHLNDLDRGFPMVIELALEDNERFGVRAEALSQELVGAIRSLR